MGDTIMLDLVVRDGPARDDARLLRKSDLFAEELGHAVKLTVARPVVPDAAGSGGMQAVRAPVR